MPHTAYLLVVGSLLLTPWLLVAVTVLGSLIHRLRHPDCSTPMFIDSTVPIAEYLDARPLHLPIRHSALDLLVTRLTGYCKACGRETHHLRGTTVEHPSCLDIQAGGVCPTCRRVTFFHLRWYPWGILSHEETGWVPYREHTPWAWLVHAASRIARWLRR